MDLIFPTDFLISAMFVAAAFVVFGVLVLRLNNQSLPLVYPTPRPIAIGGWLIVIAVLMILILLVCFFRLFELSIWVDGFWTFVPNSFAQPGYYLRMAIAIMDAISVVFALTLGCFSMFLFFKRRDITPKVMTFFLIVFFGIKSINSMIGAVSSLSVERPFNLTIRIFMIQIIAIILVIAITSLIIRYLNRAIRSKETFVLPHPSLVDHEYPDFEINKGIQ